MGTLQQMRRISPYLFGVFAVLLVAFFTLGDPTVIQGLRGSSGNPATQVIAEINGDEILYVDYETRVREEAENMKRQKQDVSDDKAVRQRVWDQMVEEILLRQQMEKLGIRITDAQVRDQMIDNPPEYLTKMFMDSAGNFMKQTYQELITHPENYVNYMGADASKIPAEEREAAVNNFRKDLMNIEKYMRESLARQELQSAVSSAVAYISPEYSKMKYKDENSFADIKYIAVTTRDVPQEAMDIKKEEIEKYYNDNKHLFKQKASRRFKYISMPMVPSKEDSTKYIRRVTSILDDLEKVAEDNDIARDSIFDLKLSEYNGINNDYTMVQDIDPNTYSYLALLGTKKIAGPIQKPDGTYFYRVDDRRTGVNEVVKASHILMRTGPGINEDSVKTELEKILKKAKVDKEPFAVLATTHSQDQGSAAKGGELGYFGKGKMVPEFDSAIAKANVGDIIGPVKTQFGYHLIYVEDKRSEDIKFSEIKLAPVMSSSTKSKLFRDAKSIQKQVQDGTPFDTVVARLKLAPMMSPFLEKGKAVLGSHYIVDITFNAKLNEVLEPMELDRYGIIVAVVSDIRETGFKPLDDVRQEISQRIGKKKQLDKAKEKIMAIYQKLSNSSSLAEAAALDPEIASLVKDLPAFKPSPAIPGIGTDAAFSAKAFSLPENKINEPFRGESGYYIVDVRNRNVPSDDKIKTDLNKYYVQLMQQEKGSAYYQWFQDIKDKSDITDKRSMFYKEY